MDEFFEALMQPGVDLPDLFARPEWHQRAACRGQGSDVWFPRANADQSKPAPQLAVNVCARCEVRRECREAGESEPFGVWCGESAADRKARRTNAA